MTAFEHTARSHQQFSTFADGIAIHPESILGAQGRDDDMALVYTTAAGDSGTRQGAQDDEHG
jgi:hypothetical protein